ncbi:MAG: toll/interleukin-1 receptor domain-containing protein [Fibromonadaceae bacterium]|jgi:hypothetical protein|nr:toll/interleukin-1 receptor domain-containing protein [Fibromonadaceae bacterium]
MSKKFEIFISYRRKGGYDTAKLIYDKLKMDGYSVSFDIETLEKGYFDKELEKRVTNCKDFILVLSPGVFDRLLNSDYDPEDDWLRRELACALKEEKNIVPLVLEGFIYPKTLPDDIKDISRKNSIDLSPKHFEGSYARMKQVFLLSKPHWAIRHKKKIISSISIAFLAFVSYLFFLISTIANQKNLELQKAKMEADSIIIAKEAEIAHIADSIKRSMRLEKKTKENSTQQAKENEASIQKSTGKALYWGSPNNGISEVIFKKIEETGIKKGECTGNGLVIKANNAKCETVNERIECYYSPRLTVTNCNDKFLFFLGTQEEFKTSPHETEAGAREELIKELNSTDFSSWVSEIKGF